MKKSTRNPVHSIQRCSCGTIRVDLGTVSIKYEKEAFLAFARTVHLAAQKLCASQSATPNVVSLKEFRPNP